ncbi:NAD-dependent epimerase/dehydratase family protein [Microbacteriaceae bacterium VKM Ac-2854]|nr:NAD-dependent epimerase/dehydratase family protein [Microbacteriaceae bacterium VKM Ac-2854]
MDVFIIGGTGYLGSVIVEKLIASGHTVTALARSERSAEQLRAAGARPLSGNIDDTDVLRAAAGSADAVVYAASDYAATEESMRAELDAVAAVVAGASSKPVIYTSTGLVYGFDPTDVSEDAELPAVSAQPVKGQAEQIVLSATNGVVIRAGLIFGRGGTGLVTGLIAAAAQNGAASYIGEGSNSWYPIHVDDLVDLYLRAIEHPVPGIFNAVGTVPFTLKELADAIGDLTGTPSVSIPLEVAQAQMGPAVRTLTTSSRLVATKAREAYGWQPRERSLIEDVRSGSYTVASVE